MEITQRSVHSSKHGAVIFKNKRIYSVGYNQPFRSVKSVNPIARKWETSIHAEIDCIIKARRELKGLDLLVVRINNKGQFLLSKPCSYCLNYIDYVGIKNIYYSILEYPFIERL